MTLEYTGLREGSGAGLLAVCSIGHETRASHVSGWTRDSIALEIQPAHDL